MKCVFSVVVQVMMSGVIGGVDKGLSRYFVGVKFDVVGMVCVSEYEYLCGVCFKVDVVVECVGFYGGKGMSVGDEFDFCLQDYGVDEQICVDSVFDVIQVFYDCVNVGEVYVSIMISL